MAVIVSISMVVIAGAQLVADDATDRGPTERPERAAIRQDGTRDAPDTRASQGILVASRHLATTARADHNGQGHRTDGCQLLSRVHWNVSVVVDGRLPVILAIHR